MMFRIERFVKIVRRPPYKNVMLLNLSLVFVSGSVLLAGRLLPLDRIPFRVCLFFRVTGYPCPTCGLTRGFVAMARGHWFTAMMDCPLAFLMYLMVALIFVWNCVPVVSGFSLKRGSALQLSKKRIIPLILILLALVFGNWFYRLSFGLN